MTAGTPIPKIMLTAGEPAGIGPELVLLLAQHTFPAQLIVSASKTLLQQRADDLNLTVSLREYDPHAPSARHTPGELWLVDEQLAADVTAGRASRANASYVLKTIKTAVTACLDGECAAMVTGPVSKSVIAEAGFAFSGHTEYIAGLCGDYLPVMLLVNDFCRVALVTTHLPLHQVAAAITTERLQQTITIVAKDLRQRFGLARPRIVICGLNPHAGEQGYLGDEEIRIIAPVVKNLQTQNLQTKGYALHGPVPADTAFTSAVLKQADVVLTMYHDQGLPVIKSHGFGETVNVTLGLPVIRTSVDHGTAFELAGTGQADPQSLIAAVNMAITLVNHHKPGPA